MLADKLSIYVDTYNIVNINNIKLRKYENVHKNSNQ